MTTILFLLNREIEFFFHLKYFLCFQSFPKTTYQAHCDNTLLKGDYTEKEVQKCMVNTGSFNHLALENRYEQS